MSMPSSLAEQLREYQARSKNDRATLSFFASASFSNTPSQVKHLLEYKKCRPMITSEALILSSLNLDSVLVPVQKFFLNVAIAQLLLKASLIRVDVMFVLWELLMFAFLVFSGVALYLRHMKLSFLLSCVTALNLVCIRITKQVRQNRKSKRRMLLPLSM